MIFSVIKYRINISSKFSGSSSRFNKEEGEEGEEGEEEGEEEEEEEEELYVGNNGLF
jgi:ribosomal protein L12E/L44/L45/RPP1/RPP2